MEGYENRNMNDGMDNIQDSTRSNTQDNGYSGQTNGYGAADSTDSRGTLNTTDDMNSHSTYSAPQNTVGGTYGSNSQGMYRSNTGMGPQGGTPYTGYHNPGTQSGYGFQGSSAQNGYQNGFQGNGTPNGYHNMGTQGTYGTAGSGYAGQSNGYSYNAQGQGTYGNGSGTGTSTYTATQTKPAKNGNWKKVAAVVAIAAILVTGVGVAYIGTHRPKFNVTVEKSSDSAKAGSSAGSGSFSSSDGEGSHSGNIGNSSDDKAPVDSAAVDKSIKTTTMGDSVPRTVVTDITEVVQNVMPAIVSIHNNYTTSASYFGQVYSSEQTASGSGIIVGKSDTELLVATNYHVIEGADTLEVIFCNDDTIEAAVKGTDADMDLAVIAVQLADISDQTASEISIATLGDSDALTVGEPAIAIGNALGYGLSVTQGCVSALNRMIELDDGSTGTFIQTDAAINPGNSGGALLNLSGQVIGINSNKIGGSAIEGMGYAIPISTARPIIEKLMNETTRIRVSSENRGYIGISGVTVTSSVAQAYGMPRGVYVADVTSASGAAAAGIQKGDVIMELNGEEIISMDDLLKKLEYYSAGETVELRIARQDGTGYRYGDVSVKLSSYSSLQMEDENAGANGEQYDGDAPSNGGSKSGSENGGFGTDGFQFPSIPGFNFNFPEGSDGNSNWEYHDDGNGGGTWEFHFGG